MKTNKIIMITAVAAVLATGCGKDDGRLRIVAGNMHGDAKLLVDPSTYNTSWITGETINLNGTLATIAEDQQHSGEYYLDGVTSLGVYMHAVYPGSNFGGNDVTVSNSASGSGTVVLNRLRVTFRGDGSHEVLFPMAAEANSGATRLLFDHLTAGFKLTLQNTTGANLDIASLKVVARSDNAVSHLAGDDGVTARWAVQGPSLPSGPVGSIDGDQVVKFSSEMMFDLYNGATNHVTVGNGSSITFCVPVTISSVRYLTFTAYNAAGQELFNLAKDLCPNDEAEVAVVRNMMYDIPTLVIN